MPFRSPFLKACERFIKNTSSSRIKLIKRLFYCFILNKPIGASPRRDEDGTILVCSTYSTYTVLIGTSKKGGNAPRATDKKNMRW
jgi:hypothetical protein